MKKLNDLPRFSVRYQYSKENSSTDLFMTPEAANTAYQSIKSDLLSETNRLESRHWNNNTEGLEVELCELTMLPQSDIEDITAAETEKEQEELWNEALFTYSEKLFSTFTYLSDEFNENLGDKGEFVIKEREIQGGTYSTIPFSKDCVSLIDGSEVVAKGAIK